MLYLYTLLMFAWDLDEDTHAYFREYLEVFITHRKTSKAVRAFRDEACGSCCWSEDLNRLKINPIRYGLRRRVAGARNAMDYRRFPLCPVLISHIHPTRYYIAGILGNHSNVRVNSSTLADTISFHVPPAEDIIRICKEHNCNVPAFASAYINEEFHIRTVPNEKYLIRYMMKMEDLCTI